MCYNQGKHEVYSFKEIATCEYEIIILSPLLCEHPEFKPKDVSENIINCMPLEGSPKKPRSLLKNEVEVMKFNSHAMKLMNSVGFFYHNRICFFFVCYLFMYFFFYNSISF